MADHPVSYMLLFILIGVNLYACYCAFYSQRHSRHKKILLILLPWIFPLLGAKIVIFLTVDIPRLETLPG